MGRDPEGRSGSVFLTRWLSFFGVDPVVVVLLWNMIGVPFFDTGDLSHAKPEHLLWGFLFLRKYGDESGLAARCGNKPSTIPTIQTRMATPYARIIMRLTCVHSVWQPILVTHFQRLSAKRFMCSMSVCRPKIVVVSRPVLVSIILTFLMLTSNSF
jgi:hypothetical protein